MAQRTQFFPLSGGLNLTTPAINTPPGHVIAAVNYEPAERGYRRIDGWERTDGRPAPSEASYWVLGFDAGTAAVSEGDTVTGATSGATGEALVDGIVDSGSYAGSDAAGRLILTGVSGTFQDDEALEVSSVQVATADGTAAQRGAATDSDDSTWLQDAIETARAKIGTVPGGGQIRGVWLYAGKRYAFRDDAASSPTECRMYEATTSGWSQVDLGRWIDFDAGTTAFTEGDTVTGGTSSATATIERVVVESGDWSSNDADGYLVLSNVSGTFQDNETITDGASGSATSDGADSAITLSPGGTFRFLNHNFYGAADKKRMYGCDGVNRAFEFDGSVFAPIRTGMDTDTPEYIAEHRNHLFLAFPGGSLQSSGTGEPLSWTVVTGASEIGLGTEITGLLSNVSSALVVFGRTKVAVLQGDDAANWVLRTLADDAGALPNTAQRMGEPVYMDDRGLRGLSATDAYGDFRKATLTRLVDPLLRAKKAAGVTPTASIRVRAKDQYRVFFSDNTGLTVFLGREQPETLPFDLGMPARCAVSGEDTDGNEVLLIGSDDGYVYQLDAGTSADGEAVDAYLRLPFNHLGAPTQRKRFHKSTLEVDAGPDTSIGLTAEFSYADAGQPPVDEQSFTVSGGGGFWGQDQWGGFYWSAPVEGRAEAYLPGIGVNVSITAASATTYAPPHTMHGLILHYSLRGLDR
jgi:hypothetical protein